MAEPTHDEELLQRYVDGEVSTAEAERLEASLKDSAELRQRHQELLRFRELMRASAEEMMTQVHSDALFARIERGIEAQGPSSAFERMKLWLGEFFQHRAGVWMPAAGATAMAAVVLLKVSLT